MLSAVVPVGKFSHKTRTSSTYKIIARETHIIYFNLKYFITIYSCIHVKKRKFTAFCYLKI